MEKRKRTKGQTLIENKRSSNANPSKNGSVFMYSGRLMSSCSTSGTGCAILEGQDKTIQWRKEKEQTAKCNTLH
jgi:hypothetical protein